MLHSRLYKYRLLFSVQFSSVAQLCPTLCDPMNCSMPGLPVHHQLPEFTQTHVHQVGDAIQPSHPLLSPSHPAFNLSHYQGLFKWVSSSHQVAKVLELQLQHQSFQWIFRTDFLYDGLIGSPCCPRDSQESSPTPQFKSINSSVLSLLHSPTLTSIHDYWKNWVVRVLYIFLMLLTPYHFGAPKSLQMVTAAMKLKDACSLEEKLWPRQHIKKQRHYFAKKNPSSKSYGFFSSHVRMW